SGFTWRDDYTQHVIGQELSTIHKIHSRLPDVFASEGSDTSYIYNDPMRYYSRQNPKERSPPLGLVSKPLQELSGRTLSQRQPDKVSPEPGMGLEQKSLMAALHSYITQNLSAQSTAKSPLSRTKGSQLYAERSHSMRVSPFDQAFEKLYLGLVECNLCVFCFKNNIILLMQENTAKLIRFLNENALSENIHEDLIPEESTKTESKKSEETDASSSEETNAGVENVKSETFSRELTTAKNSESDSKDPSQTHYWIQNALIQNGNSYEKPQKKPGQGLQLEVKPSEESEYGYIVTVKDNGIEGHRIVEHSCFYYTVLH
uniref:Uncharacterized protein n=1 Tax=Malurus cyaneus samueli TaxID=2593467 RepID=A0A8C5UDU1_9PASS